MILDEWVETRWNNVTRAIYEPLGYKYTKYLDKFMVRVEHLPDKSVHLVRMRCDDPHCDNENTIKWYRYKRRGIVEYYCKSCALRMAKGTHTVESVREIFLKHNFIPLFTKYVNNRERLPCECLFHRGIIQYVKLSNILSGNTTKCRLCNCNENSVLSSFLRETTSRWSHSKKVEANFTCMLSGVKGSTATHHVYPFNKLRDDLVNSYGLTGKELRKNLTPELAAELTAKFLKMHEEVAYAVISTELHLKFHSKYGSKNFTPDNYYEFRDDYNRGLI